MYKKKNCLPLAISRLSFIWFQPCIVRETRLNSMMRCLKLNQTLYILHILSYVLYVHIIKLKCKNCFRLVFSFDARETKLSKGKHWSEEQVLGTRASFKVGIKPTALLTLDQAKSTDGGAYRCRVDFQKSPTRNHMVNLTVISK